MHVTCYNKHIEHLLTASHGEMLSYSQTQQTPFTSMVMTKGSACSGILNYSCS